MSSNILDLAYAAALLIASPWLWYCRRFQRKPVAGWSAKLSGAIGHRQTDGRCIWFHAVSVGEVLQLQTLVADYARRHPSDEIILSTTTGTGYEVARQKFPHLQIVFWPFDFSWAVTRSLRLLRPALVVLVELEVWPNFLKAAEELQIPVVVINGRLSPRSFRGYQRFKWLLRLVFRRLHHVAAQTPEYAERFVQMGVPADRVTVTGNLKFDRVESRRDRPATLALRSAFQLRPEEIVFIAGSTQETEEAAAIQCYRELATEFPQLRLMLVPRHKERFEAVAQLVNDSGYALLRRSQPPLATLERPILLLDTLGELAAAWGLADVAFVGGSLTRRGGQNMLEPAGYGAAILFGPHTHNFRDIVAELLSREAAVVVHDQLELTQVVRNWVNSAAERERYGAAARVFVESQQGATANTIEVLERALPVQRQRIAA